MILRDGKPTSTGRQENTGKKTHKRMQNMNEVGFRETLYSADESRERKRKVCLGLREKVSPYKGDPEHSMSKQTVRGWRQAYTRLTFTLNPKS